MKLFKTLLLAGASLLALSGCATARDAALSVCAKKAEAAAIAQAAIAYMNEHCPLDPQPTPTPEN